MGSKIVKAAIFAAFLVFTATPALSAQTVAVKVNGLVCDFCVSSIGMILKREPAVADSAIDLKTKIVTISLRDGQSLSDQRIGQLIEKAGYSVVSIRR